MFLSVFSLLLCTCTAQTQNSHVHAVYIFSRHGDRTAKSTPPANLTALGYQEAYTSGTYFRTRYIASDAATPLSGINSDLVKLSQISISAPLDNVLFTSAQAFSQGLYPPVGEQVGTERLRNGTEIQPPLSGYQLIPVQTVTAGTGSEDSAWLQGAGNCLNAITSSNAYFNSAQYLDLLESTKDFYSSVVPMVNKTFPMDQINFKNAYTIFDLLNVASIHNTSFPSSSLLTNDTLFRLRYLADTHELSLAYNSSEPVRAIAGATLASQVVQAFNQTITTAGKQAKLSVQFGAYASFFSFFGLASLLDLNDGDFKGVPDYSSTLSFELFSNDSVDVTSFPNTQDLNVRFLFHNGTTSNISEPAAYPLFGQQSLSLPWNDFLAGMNRFAIGDQADWCHACGNKTGVCAPFTTDSSPSSQQKSSSGGGGVSKVEAGVIGAMVTLAVMLLAAVALLLSGMLKVVKPQKGGSTGKPDEKAGTPA